jgi:hypothetical protein
MKLDKNSVIDLLSGTTPEEINQLIKSKGKPPKPVKAVYFIKKEEDSKEENQDGKC